MEPKYVSQFMNLFNYDNAYKLDKYLRPHGCAFHTSLVGTDKSYYLYFTQMQKQNSDGSITHYSFNDMYTDCFSRHDDSIIKQYYELRFDGVDSVKIISPNEAAVDNDLLKFINNAYSNIPNAFKTIALNVLKQM